MNKINYKAKFGGRLKSLRKEHGLTQEELSEVMGITAQHLSYIESRKRGPSFEFIIQASEALGVDPSELLFFDLKESKKLKNPIIKKINIFLKDLPNPELKKLEQLISIIWSN